MTLTSSPQPPTHSQVYTTADAIDFRPADLPSIPRPQRVMLTTPEHFGVEYVINPHMAGNVGTVDLDVAWRQWEALREAYTAIGITVKIVPGAEGLCDMVFCANTTLPFCTPDGRRGVVLSHMHAAERRGEVPYHEAFFREQGYDVIRLNGATGVDFEGMGDAIWHPGRYLLWGGYGIRTDARAYEALADHLALRILTLELVDPDFYHLDTCFSVLDEDSVLIIPAAFRPEGRDLIRSLFARVLEAPDDEARRLLAGNAHCPDGRHVLLQRGCTATNRLLREAGYLPIEVDTGEFLKAGGSVFCMKQMFW